MAYDVDEVTDAALPATTVRPVTETLHGVDVTDPYRWLEDGEIAAVQAWTAEQNAYTRRLLDARPERPILRERLLELMQTGFVQAPVLKGARYFYTARSGEADQAILYVRENDTDRPLVDPATLRADATVALDWWYPSDDGALVAYGLSEGGDEWSTLHVHDVDSGQDVAETIERTRYSSVAWLPDNAGFYYTRYPTPGSVPPGDENYHSDVYLHRLGSDPAADPLVYADDDPQAMLEIALAGHGRYLLIQSFHGWSRVTLLWRDLQGPEPGAFTALNEGLEGIFAIEDARESVFIHTNWEAPRYRVFKAPLAAPFRENWQEIIPEGAHTLENLKVAGSRLVAQTLENAIAHLRLFDHDGAPQGEIALPAAGTVYGPDSSHEADEVLFAFTSFAYPLTAYRYELQDSRLEVFKAPPAPVGVNPAQVGVDQVWYPSKDGTMISMFVVRRRDVAPDGERPTVLTGYGGFNVSETATFTAGLHAWLERGGVYALPNLRGGSEYGERWHEAGMLAHKQNVFDDFTAAGDWLVANGYTTPRKLACWGGSNGGLLVGAAITQRPDLFQAAVCAVPLLDMLRYHLFQIARLWIPEYGSSEDPEQFGWLYAYSPYHHVRPGVDYPATLFTTAEGDSRVDPLHARKMAALLQANTAGTRPILLRVESRAGHGQGKPVTKLVEEQADEWTFVAWQLGLSLT